MQTGAHNVDSRAALSALLAPWAITDDGLKLVREQTIAAIGHHLALQARDAVPLKEARITSVRDGVAIIPVSGPLFKSGSWISWLFGCGDYGTILKDLTSSLTSPEVRAIVLDIDSPGGEVHGCGELSAAIFAARGVKPIKAYASGMMCSAAYWLGSAAGEIIADPSAMLGSVGVRTLLVDDSKRDEMNGIREYEIVSSVSPYKVVDASKEADRARVLATINAMAEVFVSDLARNRAVPSETVKSNYGQGDVLIGKNAVSAGLADRLGDFESLIAEMADGTQTRGARMFIPGGTANMKHSKAKCDDCGGDMDDGDKLYCGSCHGSASADHAFMGQLLAVTGSKVPIEALAVVQAWKAAADELAPLKARLAEGEKTARLGAFDAELSKLTASGVIPPSEDHPKRKYAVSLREQPGGLDALRAYSAALGPAVPGSAPSSAAPAPSAQGGEPSGAQPVIALSAEERRMARKMGVSEKELLANKSRRLQLAAAPVDDEDKDDDEDDDDEDEDDKPATALA